MSVPDTFFPLTPKAAWPHLRPSPSPAAWCLSTARSGPPPPGNAALKPCSKNVQPRGARHGCKQRVLQGGPRACPVRRHGQLPGTHKACPYNTCNLFAKKASIHELALPGPRFSAFALLRAGSAALPEPIEKPQG